MGGTFKCVEVGCIQDLKEILKHCKVTEAKNTKRGKTAATETAKLHLEEVYETGKTIASFLTAITM